jgi:hypothetical protein
MPARGLWPVNAKMADPPHSQPVPWKLKRPDHERVPCKKLSVWLCWLRCPGRSV